MTTSGLPAGAKQPVGKSKRQVPSYMQPTRSSKMKENLYGTEFKFVPKKSVFDALHTPPEHGLDYVPPRPVSPGVPRFMKPTSTSKRKVAEQPKHIPTRKSQILPFGGGTYANSGVQQRLHTSPYRPARENHPSPSRMHYCYEKKDEFQLPSSVYLSFREEIAKEQRKRSYSHMTPNPAIVGSVEEPPCLSRKSTGLSDYKKSLIQTAPAPDSYRAGSSDSQFSTTGPSTPSAGTPRRPKGQLPRYMMPTTASSARIRQ